MALLTLPWSMTRQVPSSFRCSSCLAFCWSPCSTYLMCSLIVFGDAPVVGTSMHSFELFLLRLLFSDFVMGSCGPPPFLPQSLVGNFVELNRSCLLLSGTGVAHLQGLLGAWFCLSSDNNRDCVQSFVTCQPADAQGDATQESGGLRLSPVRRLSLMQMRDSSSS